MIKENQIISKFLSWCPPLLAVRANTKGHHKCLKPLYGSDLWQFLSQTEANPTSIRVIQNSIGMNKITCTP